MKQYFDYFVGALRAFLLLVVVFGFLFTPIILVKCFSPWWGVAYIAFLPVSMAALLYLGDKLI